MSPFARSAFLTLFLGLSLPGAALAKVYAFKNTPTPLSINIPDAWTINPIKNGIEIRRPDDEVLMWIQAATEKTVGPLMDEYKAYFKQQGVTFTAEPKSQEHTMGAASVLDMELPATWKGKPTVVRIAVVTKATGAVLIGYWASPKADKESDPEVNQILADIVAP